MHLPVVRESCALEAAELGGITLEEVASRLSLTRERVRHIQLGALAKV
jgi:DNA-directed RNA polymerase sigma subunit (sigma70/sigma32)